jgi:hypothetical protein
LPFFIRFSFYISPIPFPAFVLRIIFRQTNLVLKTLWLYSEKIEKTADHHLGSKEKE